MKKNIVTLLIATMLVLAFAGCGSSQTNEGSDTQTNESGDLQADTDEGNQSNEGKSTQALESDGFYLEGDCGDAVELIVDGFDDDDVITSILLQTNAASICALDLHIADENGEYVQPNGALKVTLDLEEFFGEVEDGYYQVYREEDDSTYVALETTVTDNKLEFKTSHFSVYAIVITSEPLDIDGDMLKIEIKPQEELLAELEAEAAANADQGSNSNYSSWPAASSYELQTFMDGSQRYLSIIDIDQAQQEALFANDSNALDTWCGRMEELNASKYNITNFYCSAFKGGSFICGTDNAADIVKTQQLLDELVASNNFTVVARWDH